MDRFEDHIEIQHLVALMDKFHRHQPSEEMPAEGTYSPSGVVRREPGNVTLGEFKEMLSSLGISTSGDQTELLFAKIDTSADGMVDWNEFCNYMLLHYREKDKTTHREGMRLVGEPSIQHLSKIKQDSVQALTVCESPLRYISLSKEGYLCNFDHNMQLEITHQVRRAEDEHGASRNRRFRAWCTGLTYLGNVNMIAVSSSGRDIKFFDVVAHGFVEIFNIYDIQDVPSCLDYGYDVRKPHDESLLLMGSDTGSIHLFYFQNPCKRLFEIDGKSDQRVQHIWMPELSVHHHEYVRHTRLMSVHTELIRKVKYLPVKDLLVSSSGSSKTSVVIADIKGRRRSYIFGRKKGVECFDYSSKFNLLLTGSVDHKVLAWNPYMEHKPMSVLLGHQMAVMGVAINEVTGHAYSISKDGMLKVWELHNYHCLQTLHVGFPCLRNVKQPEFMHASMLLHHNQTLVIGVRDYLAHLRVGKTEDFRQGMVTTHGNQLCSAIYNPFFQQMATGADDSSISVWDVESGTKSFSITEAHGSEEITCMAFSTAGRKLYTGARNGSIKVWNFQNGHNIHQCEAVAESEVTGLVSLGKRGFLAVGWSRQITFYDDSDSDVIQIKPSEDSWRGGHLHKDDILAIDYSPPGLLATASFDGEILVWSSETQALLFRLRKGQSVKEFTQAPVDKLLFLRWRIQRGMSDCAVLVASEAGSLHFWSVYDTQHHRGKFYSSSYPDQSVLAIATDPRNVLLLTGDTKGSIYVWDIHQYCINSETQDASSPPPLITSWLAHDAAVVSVEVVTLSYGCFVLSASVDQTARLWTIEGHYIGTFGQDRKWNLRDPTTFLHPMNPWSVVHEGAGQENQEAQERDASNPEESRPIVEDGNTTESRVEEYKAYKTDGSSDPDNPPVPARTGPDLIFATNPEGPISISRVPSAEGTVSAPITAGSADPEAGFLERDADKEPTKTKHEESTQHSLGQTVDRRFADITETRKQRREKYSKLVDSENLTYGRQCKPFQALVTPDTAEIDFLASLPLSTRMQQQGLEINSESDLSKLTFDGEDISFTIFHKPPKDKRSTTQSPKN